MNVFLMYRDRDFDEQAELPWNQKELEQDLELPTLFESMARDDKLIHDVARKAVLLSLDDLETIRYRQDILTDCLNNPQVARELYALTLESIKRKRESWFSGFSRYYPSSILNSAVNLLEMFVDLLRQLRKIAENRGPAFRSEGFRSLFAMLRRELSEEYLAQIQDQLKELELRKGAILSARLGEGNKGIDYVLRRPNGNKGWLKTLLSKGPATCSFRIAERDESGARMLGEMRDQGINPVANALAQSADHIVGFFTMLRTELAFYLGCLNLSEELARRGQPVCLPDPAADRERVQGAEGLYDPCLALAMQGTVVGSEVQADAKELVFITGANQGGKSTFLRSIGVAQLMMQCGMFAPARSFRANICRGLFTHFRREEDASMKSGKFDEELGRMSGIVDHVREDSLLLFNESFSATNEREGSEVARQIVTALLDRKIKVFFVTHMYELAHSFDGGSRGGAVLFLRAGRREDGTRTFKVSEGEPLQTSYGKDLYERIFTPEGREQARSA
jgi:DNA mismatch repair ATPase MutS